jgi:hypothetical protein
MSERERKAVTIFVTICLLWTFFVIGVTLL